MIALVLFHAINHFIIFDDIGWFPLVGITTAFIFLEPDWPARLLNRWRASRAADREAGGGKKSRKPARLSTSPQLVEQTAVRLRPVSSTTSGFVFLWLAWQSLLPLRHLFIPADTRFT